MIEFSIPVHFECYEELLAEFTVKYGHGQTYKLSFHNPRAAIHSTSCASKEHTEHVNKHNQFMQAALGGDDNILFAKGHNE